MRAKILTLLFLMCATTLSYAQEIEIAESENYSFNISKESVKSDVDMDIPVTKDKNNNTYVIIIANEDYQTFSDVTFALNDGKMFNEYCQKTLGIPQANIQYLPNATLNTMRRAINTLKTKLNNTANGNAKAIVYYSGHGTPDVKTESAYLLPVDSYDDMQSAMSLSWMYEKLGEANSGQVTYFLDACFSGAGRDGLALSDDRAVMIKPKETPVANNSIVFSAATGTQTAHPYHEKQHGIFTYFLLKKLQETKGDVSYGELSDYINSNVRAIAAKNNNKEQTPTTVAGTPDNSWKSIKLK